MAENISRQPNIESDTWCRLAVKKKKRSSGAKRNKKIYSSKRKRAPGDLMFKPTLMLKEIKERPYAKWNKRVAASGQDHPQLILKLGKG